MSTLEEPTTCSYAACVAPGEYRVSIVGLPFSPLCLDHAAEVTRAATSFRRVFGDTADGALSWSLGVGATPR